MTAPNVANPVDRLERAMRAAYHDLDMAEKREQPARVLDQFEAAYFRALRAYEQVMGKEAA